jgi:hypothetical protein
MVGRNGLIQDATANPIAAKLIGKMKLALNRKVVDLKNFAAGLRTAEELQKQVASKERLNEFHPAHAAYVYAQNQVSVMSEQLTALKEMAPFVAIISKAEDLYSPSAPPMSPLTTSYFTCWAFFDACAGPANETIGTITLEVGTAFGMHADLLHLIRSMQDSRMGLYSHEGTEGDLVILKDVVTSNVLRAISPAGYRGTRGELWYVRVLPPPIPGHFEHVVFTTPYVVLHPELHDWLGYFRRAFGQNQPPHIEDYQRHMKYGPTRAYWNDFVFEGYVNHRADVIFLAGLPDIPESRPHSQVNGWGLGQ